MTDRWKRFENWLRAVKAWLLEARHVLFATIVALAALCVILGGNETAIRWAGMVLQLLGIGTVILGIEKTREFFGHPSTIASLWRWLKRFPPLGGRTHTISMDGNMPSMSGSARGYVSARADPNASIESRVEVLEKNIERLHERINTTESEMDSRFRMQKQELKEEKNARESEDQKIFAKLEATKLGGVHISAIGAIWLFVGVILSSIPKELSNWFS